MSDPTTDALARWGWNDHFAATWRELEAGGERDADAEPARVCTEYRGGYVVASAHGDLTAISSGKLRRAVKIDRVDKPAVGDWVIVSSRPGEGSAMIHAVVPRRTCVLRRASGRDALPQVVAANVDVVLIATALSGDLNVRRLERYLSVVRDSGARPVLALTKVDLCTDVAAALAEVATVAGDAQVHALSSLTGAGVEALDRLFDDNATVALIGSSGVGKSTLINRWLGSERMVTKTVAEDGRGRHTTSHRELFVRPGGGLVMDTPGMRELGLWDAEDGVRDTFADVSAVAGECRFRDCKHVGEPGCAVGAAIAAGTLARDRFESWKKLTDEMGATGAEAARMRKRGEKVQTKSLEKLLRGRHDD